MYIMGMLGLNNINVVLVGTSDPIFRNNFSIGIPEGEVEYHHHPKEVYLSSRHVRAIT